MKAFLPILLLMAWVPLQADPTLRFALPERFRLLVDQQFDLRLEAENLGSTNGLSLELFINDEPMDPLPQAVVAWGQNDLPDLDVSWTFPRLSFGVAGIHSLKAVLRQEGEVLGSATRRVGIQDFKLVGRKNIILFVGDALGTAYRDAGRIVGRSVDNRLREGFFDQLLEMDKLPVSGMVITHAYDRLTPDSANTAAAWSMGNKTVAAAVGVLPDNTGDPRDNPKVESLWEYLKRRHGYKTGIVTTSDLTDATPAAAGAHVANRTDSYWIAHQITMGTFTAGSPFDVILGGGRVHFSSPVPPEKRPRIETLQSQGFTYVTNRTQLLELGSGAAAPDKLLGLFANWNMAPAYDKLGLPRPSDEARSQPDSPDQPFLDEMTRVALEVLKKEDHGFILLVEGALIDKESHANNMAGQVWDTLELDKAVGVGRQFSRSQAEPNTLILVTGDHDQSMTILGVIDTVFPGSDSNVRSAEVYPGFSLFASSGVGGQNAGEVEGFPDYKDANGDGYPENDNRYRLGVGFRTMNHTASSVPITAEGPGAWMFSGYYDQTDIFFRMARVLSFNTKNLDKVFSERPQIADRDYPIRPARIR